MKLLKSPVQKPGSDLGGGRRIPCGILVARPQVWQGPGCGFWCSSWALGLWCTSWCDGELPQATPPFWLFPSGWLALGFLELSVVQFLSLQDHEAGESWKPREQGQLRLETCHQVMARGQVEGVVGSPGKQVSPGSQSHCPQGTATSCPPSVKRGT